MNPQPQPSDADLARIAPHQARQAAKSSGGEARAPRRRSQAVVRRDGRETSGFAAVVTDLMADWARELPAVDRTMLDRWPAVVAAVSPWLPDHVQAVGPGSWQGAAAFCAEQRHFLDADVRPDTMPPRGMRPMAASATGDVHTEFDQHLGP